MSCTPTVHILLASYQGAAHLGDQLDSIARQTHTDWTLLVSDDGSADDSVAIVQRFAKAHAPKVSLIQGPRRGATANFFHLINTVATGGASDLYAFCDQDDVWLPDKLQAAVAWHARQPHPEAPNLYCGRTRITDASLVPQGASDSPRRALTFGNALTQNIASGNTMVFTARLLEILRQIDPGHAIWHDWSAYQVATACGGAVHFDREAHLLYRQHAANVVGARDGLMARLQRLQDNLRGRYRARGQLTERAMQDIEAQMTEEARRVFAAYQGARHAPGALRRLRYAHAAGLSRQRWREQVALACAIWAGLV